MSESESALHDGHHEDVNGAARSRNSPFRHESLRVLCYDYDYRESDHVRGHAHENVNGPKKMVSE